MSERDNDIRYQEREDRQVTEKELNEFIRQERMKRDEMIDRYLEESKAKRKEAVKSRTKKQDELKKKTNKMRTIWIVTLYVLQFATCLTFVVLDFSTVEGIIIFTILCFIGTYAIDYFFCWLLFKIDDSDMKVGLGLWVSFCILCFIITSILLSQTLFNINKEYSDFEFYEVPETVCYITDTGECYHKESCGYLHSKIQISVSSAKAQGYRPCSSCWSDTYIEERTVTRHKRENHYILSYFVSLVFWLTLCVLADLIYFKGIKKKTS